MRHKNRQTGSERNWPKSRKIYSKRFETKEFKRWKENNYLKENRRLLLPKRKRKMRTKKTVGTT